MVVEFFCEFNGNIIYSIGWWDIFWSGENIWMGWKAEVLIISANHILMDIFLLQGLKQRTSIFGHIHVDRMLI